MLPWGRGPLTLLWSIAKVPDRQVVYFLTFFFLSFSISQANTIMAEAITVIQMQKKKNGINHWVLHSLLIVIIALELFLVVWNWRCYGNEAQLGSEW